MNIISLIPKTLQQKAINSIVDFVVDLAEGHLKGELTNKLKLLRSDGAFQKAFDQGIQRAFKRFTDEYVYEE